MERPTIAHPRRDGPILICKKCLKRSRQANKIRRELKSELKHRPRIARKAAKLVYSGCFGICPKKAVVLASGSSLHNGEYILISRSAQIEDALVLLRGSK